DRPAVDRGPAASRERARALILAGLVEVSGRVVDKAGALAEPDQVALRAPDHPYVSRGALKLVHALDRFGIDPAGAVAVDVGASTGGLPAAAVPRGAPRGVRGDVGFRPLGSGARRD